MGLDYGQYGYDHLGSSLNAGSGMGLGALIWLIIVLVVALVGCFVIYFMFVKPDKKIENKTLAWFKGFLRFDKMLIEDILKISYIFEVILITLGSFALIGTNFFAFLGVLIGGNLLARIIYEAGLIMIMIWKNTTEINKKTK